MNKTEVIENDNASDPKSDILLNIRQSYVYHQSVERKHNIRRANTIF